MLHYRKHLMRTFNKLSPFRVLLLFYFIAMIVSTFLLSLPIAYKDGVQIDFIDIAFTAVSALSVTGLTTVSIVDTFSVPGIFIIIFILQLGAVGIMAIGTFIWLFLGKKIGMKERRLIMTDQNQTTFSGIVRLVEQIVILLLAIELISFIVLGTYFLKYFSTAKEAYLQGLFTTVSAITNGGFDLTGISLQPYAHDYFVQIIIMFLIIFGAIGFPVIIEVKNYLLRKRKQKRKFRFSLFTKVTTTTFFSLVIVGTFVIYLLDYNNFFKGKGFVEGLFYALFQSVTTRSAGLSTLDVNLLTEQNHLFMSFLMFIGASPSSAGGGIRTTTFALVVIFIITYARGGKGVRLFKREVYQEDLLKAVTVMLMAMIFVFASLLVLMSIEPYSMMQILFDVTSAFGTVGLSLGITGDLTVVSKVILMFLMFVGRVGVITFLFIFKNERTTSNYRYPKERMIIG